MSNQNGGEEWSKAKYGGHLQDEGGSETAIDVKDNDPCMTATLDENLGMDGNFHQIFGMVELVSKILSYLPTCDIKSCNGVSSLWRQEARKLLLQRTRMEFGGGGQDLRLQVDSYIEEMGNNCHQSISIHSLGNNNAQRVAVTRLGNKYGHKVKKLYMTMGNPNILQSYNNITMLSITLDLDNFINIPQDLIMPNVKALSIKVNQSQTTFYESWIISLLTHEHRGLVAMTTGIAQSLLRMCPMMEYLDLDNAAQRPFFELFQESEPDELIIPSQLSGLGLTGTNFFLRLPSLRLLNIFATLQLTMLEIDFYGTRDNLVQPLLSLPQLQAILTAFAPTLEHLKLFRIPPTDGAFGTTESTVKFPEMPKLETLEITHLSISFFKFTFGDGPAQGIDYTKQFPVLKKLSIKSLDAVGDGSCVNGSLVLCEMFFPEGTPPCSTLTQVDVGCTPDIKHGDNCNREGYCFCKKEGPVWNMLKRLITMLPNVEKFKKCGGWQW